MNTVSYSIEQLRELKKQIESPDPWEALKAIEQVLTTMFDTKNRPTHQQPEPPLNNKSKNH